MAETSQLIRYTVAFIRKTWPDVIVDEDRVNGWIAEVDGGGGRSPEELKSDILQYVVGKERVTEYVSAAFSERGLSADAARISRITGELMDEGRAFSELNTTLDKFGTRTSTTPPPEEDEEGDTPPPTGETTTVPGVMSGGTLTKIVRNKQDDLWAMSYSVGGVKHVYAFGSYNDMTAALGPDAVSSGTYGFDRVDGDTYDKGLANGSIWNLGSAVPLIGQSDGYAAFFQDVVMDAGLAAGIRTPGAVSDYLKDPDIQRIMGSAIQGDWSLPQTQAEIRGTKYYQNVLYPGITTLLDQGIPEPEAKWWQYHDGVENNLAMLGYKRDKDGTYRTDIGKMLAKGISDTVFNAMAPEYHRAANSPEFAGALDYWLDKTAGRSVSFDDIFDAMSGQSEGDLAVAVESAVIQFQSDLTNTNLSSNQISRIASMTELSEQEIATSFTTAEENLLSLGNRGLKRYGLSEDALVSSAFNLKSGAGTAEEVRRLAAKTMRELGLQDDEKAQFYASFNERGSLIKPGLSALTPEAG